MDPLTLMITLAVVGVILWLIATSAATVWERRARRVLDNIPPNRGTCATSVSTKGGDMAKKATTQALQGAKKKKIVDSDVLIGAAITAVEALGDYIYVVEDALRECLEESKGDTK